MKNNKSKYNCIYLSKNKQSCTNQADWLVSYDNGNKVNFSCTKHLGYNMSKDASFVFPIEELESRFKEGSVDVAFSIGHKNKKSKDYIEVTFDSSNEFADGISYSSNIVEKYMGYCYDPNLYAFLFTIAQDLKDKEIIERTIGLDSESFVF